MSASQNGFLVTIYHSINGWYVQRKLHAVVHSGFPGTVTGAPGVVQLGQPIWPLIVQRKLRARIVNGYT
jgi:hypothetical protein